MKVQTKAGVTSTVFVVGQVPLCKVIFQWVESIRTWPCGGLMRNTVVRENKCPSDCSPPRVWIQTRLPFLSEAFSVCYVTAQNGEVCFFCFCSFKLSVSSKGSQAAFHSQAANWATVWRHFQEQLEQVEITARPPELQHFILSLCCDTDDSTETLKLCFFTACIEKQVVILKNKWCV